MTLPESQQLLKEMRSDPPHVRRTRRSWPLPVGRRCFSSLRARPRHLPPQQWRRKPLPAALGPQGATCPQLTRCPHGRWAATLGASLRRGPSWKASCGACRGVSCGRFIRDPRTAIDLFPVTPMSPPKPPSPSSGSRRRLPLHRCRTMTVTAQPRRNVPCRPRDGLRVAVIRANQSTTPGLFPRPCEAGARGAVRRVRGAGPLTAAA